MDFADCFDIGGGVGGAVPYVRVKVTDYFVVGGGEVQTIFALGWHGRYTGMGTPVETGKGVPFAWNEECAGAPPMVMTQSPFVTTREYDPAATPCRGTEFADRFWIGAWLTWGLSGRFGFNPVELADFLAGWFGLDLLKDDEAEPVDWQKRFREKEPPRPVL
jgi:hypothetical protein